MPFLQSAFDKVKDEKPINVRLYLITRDIKPGIPKTKKMLDKFTFMSFSIEIDENLQQYLLNLLIKQMEMKLDPKFEHVEYEIIDDDTQKLYTYTLSDNKVLPFANSIKEQLSQGVDIKPVMKLEDLHDNIWAYCIGILHDDKKPTYSFRKFARSKIAVDEPQDTIKKPIHYFRTRFNTANSKLELLTGETINLDKSIDCIFIEDKFYIFSKKNFENIVGLEEEFKENAIGMISEIAKLDLIEGLELIISEIETNPALSRKLAKLASRADYKNLTKDRIKIMQKIAAAYGQELKVENGKLKISDHKDIDLIIKMLDDYFLESPQTGNKYGSHAKKQF